MVECFSQAASECRIESACKLRSAFHKAAQAFYAVLDTCTLADLIENRTAMTRLLRIAQPGFLTGIPDARMWRVPR